jgi:hypothetical protein
MNDRSEQQSHPGFNVWRALKEDLTFLRPFLISPEPNFVGQFGLSVSCPFMLLLIVVGRFGLSVSCPFMLLLIVVGQFGLSASCPFMLLLIVVGQFGLSVSCPFMHLLIVVGQFGLSVSLVLVSWDTIVLSVS